VRIILIVLLVLSIFTVFATPTFYEAYIEHTVLKASRQVARMASVKTGTDHGVAFIRGQEPGYRIFVDKNSNGKFDPDDAVVRTVALEGINRSIKFSSAFDDKGVIFTDDTFVFRGDGKSDQTGVTGHDSIFIVNSSDDRKGVMERVIRVYVDRSNNDIQILRVTGKTGDGDIIFGEIVS
jgi:hypothetical protein